MVLSMLYMEELRLSQTSVPTKISGLFHLLEEMELESTSTRLLALMERELSVIWELRTMLS